MEKQQELEWEAAQSIAISVDLVSAAKRQLKFLAAVDLNRWLYDSAGLDRAIYRYNAYWLPLLAKHSESPLFEGPLVVPLDCEWIWHSHRLNPIRYKKDCEEFYGRILDNKNVVSSVEGTSRKQTEEAWKTLFPGEPFELDMEIQQENMSGQRVVAENFTKYDLISAVQRQTPFFHQVSQLHMNDARYIEGAVARYRGFLHLIKRNKEQGIKSFVVPTYDIDLIWHTHQLHPASYSEDLLKLMGRILEHDDTDSDRSKGQKLDVGFTGTNRTFEDLFGRRYWRAGAMYKGSAPSPVRLTPYSGNSMKKVQSCNESPKIALPAMKVFEVMLEFVGVRNLPEEHKGSLFVSFSKSQPDKIFNDKRTLKVVSGSGEKQVATFHCQPTGNLLFELMSSPSVSIGTTSISLENFLSPDSDLTEEKWLDLVPSSNITESKPVGLRVAISVTIPTPAPYTLNMVRSQQPLPVKVQFSRNLTRVVDQDGNMVLNLHMRDLPKSRGKKECRRRVVVGIMASGKTFTLAEFAGSKWSMVNSPWSVKLPNANNDDGHLFELTGPHTIRFFRGGRLDYESRGSAKLNQHELHLFTAVKFSAEELYGTAVALLDTKSGTIKVKEEWFVLPGIIVTFILGNILRKTNQAPLQKAMGVRAATKEGCGNMAKSGGCGSMMANCGVSGGCGGCGSMMGNCGVSGGCGGCGSMMANCGVSGGKSRNMMANCGVSGVSVTLGVSGKMMANPGVSGASGSCGVSGKMMANCGVSGASGSCGVSSGGCGSMMANCGVSGGAKSESAMASCGVSGGAKSESGMANCGVTAISGACGVSSGESGSMMANCGVSGGAKSTSGMANCGVSNGESGSMMANCGVSGGAKSKSGMANCGVSAVSGACGVSSGEFGSMMAVSGGAKSKSVMANCGVSSGESGSMMANCGVGGGVKSESVMANCGVSGGENGSMMANCAAIMANCGVSSGCGASAGETGSMMANCGVSGGAESKNVMANCGVSAVSGACGVSNGESGSMMANCGVSGGVISENVMANCGVSAVSGACGVSSGESGSVMASCGVGGGAESENVMANCGVSSGESEKMMANCGVSAVSGACGVSNGESESMMANCGVSGGESTKCGGCGVSVEVVGTAVEAN